jgi:carbon storage regulator
MLTRMIGEIIRIADHITVAVLWMTGSQVRLGIDAPKDIPVHREEIFERIKHERDPQPE